MLAAHLIIIACQVLKETETGQHNGRNLDEPLALQQAHPSAIPLTWQLRKLRNRSHCTVLMISSFRRERDESCTLAACKKFCKQASNEIYEEWESARVGKHTAKACSTAA